MNTKPTETISDFFDKILDIKDKNRGGCLFFCYLFWLWLKQQGLPTESFTIVQHNWGKGCIEHNIQWINNLLNGNKNTESPVSSWHFTWIYDGVKYDSDGEYDDKDSTLVSKELVGLNTNMCQLVEVFCEHALNKGSWNPSFDRNEAIEIIYERFGIDMWKVAD